jgi:AbrB family looped-hinge helix DNA binding protein
LNMRTTAVVNGKGQVTIPKTLRVALGITSGSRLEFREHEGGFLACRVATRDAFEAMVGLGLGGTTDLALSALRGPRRNRKTDGR